MMTGYRSVMTALMLCSLHTHGLDNGLARTPPLGWITGERFYCNIDCVNYPNDCISEQLVKSTADVLSSAEFKSSGFEYMLLGDCWMSPNRDSNGKLQADVKRFPSGMEDIVDYVHSRGLKLGVYLDTGNMTCNGFPGSQDHLQVDAQTLSSWKLDVVKLNGCNTHDPHQYNQLYPEFGHYLNQTGRSFLYLCEWPDLLKPYGYKIDYKAVSDTCNIYKVYPDMIDSWLGLHDTVKWFGDNYRDFFNYTKPGSFMMSSQLLVGDYGLSYNQQKIQMALWCIMSSPLLVSADLRIISNKEKSILLNPLALQINQDPLGIMGYQKTVMGQVRVWIKPILPSGSFALALVYENISGGPTKVTIKLQDIGFTTAAAYNFTDVFQRQPMGVYKPWYTLNCEVEPTGVLFIHAQALP